MNRVGPFLMIVAAFVLGLAAAFVPAFWPILAGLAVVVGTTLLAAGLWFTNRSSSGN